MKRFLSLFLSFLMIFVMFPADAEDIDIYDLTYDEKRALFEELSEYFDKSFVLEPGIYAVGKDIKVGTYRFMYSPDAFLFSRVRIGSEINISKTDLVYDRQHFDLYNPFAMGYWFQTTEAYFRLKQGDYIVIEVDRIRMEPSDTELKW